MLCFAGPPRSARSHPLQPEANAAMEKFPPKCQKKRCVGALARCHCNLPLAELAIAGVSDGLLYVSSRAWGGETIGFLINWPPVANHFLGKRRGGHRLPGSLLASLVPSQNLCHFYFALESVASPYGYPQMPQGSVETAPLLRLVRPPPTKKPVRSETKTTQ